MQAVRFATLFVTLIALDSHAQQTSPWQGEWGLDDISASRLTISSCSGASCNFHLSHGGCGTLTNTPLSIVSDTEAVANLPGEDAAHACVLHLQRDSSAAKPTIAVKQSGNGCAYYCISGGTGFDVKVIQHATTVYAGQHSEECMKDAGPARMATCLDASLADLEKRWEQLFPDFPLLPVPEGSNGYQQVTELDAAIVTQCNTAADPAQCVRTRFTADIAMMEAKQAAYIAGYTERGDAAEGGRLARSIAGRYRHTFENGDVQGHSYRSTDTLALIPVGKASISFDAELNFYNGHSCSLSGGALYRKDGSFVFDDNPTNASPGDPVCHLAIIPTSKGISFKDLTGGCKNYCGARGSWDGEAFTFRERVAPRTASASTASPAK